jgi:hypothetical protein
MQHVVEQHGTAKLQESSRRKDTTKEFSRKSCQAALHMVAHGYLKGPARASSFNAFTLHKDEFKDIVQTSEYSSATDHLLFCHRPWLSMAKVAF